MKRVLAVLIAMMLCLSCEAGVLPDVLSQVPSPTDVLGRLPDGEHTTFAGNRVVEYSDVSYSEYLLLSDYLESCGCTLVSGTVQDGKVDCTVSYKGIEFDIKYEYEGKRNLTVSYPTYALVSTELYTLKNENDPVCTIKMADGGIIILELYPDTAPQTVGNFISLANSGFYDGLTFHRVISGFMIQGGDPNGNGSGGPGYRIKGEFSQNGFANPLSHKRGVISMARAQDMNSAGSQFFIMHADSAYLDGAYAAFGEVVFGMNTVDRIAAVKTGSSDRPVEPCVIESIRVDTKGKEYPFDKQ